MTTWAVAMVRDEADIIRQMVRHTLAHVDGMLVLDNRSTDGTTELLAELVKAHDGRLFVTPDPEVGYYQSVKTTRLAHQAHDNHGATWIVPVDADEIWCHPERIADLCAWQDPRVDVIEADAFHHAPTGDDDGVELDPVTRLRWRNRERGAGKVAVRWAPGLEIAQGNHGASYFGVRAKHAAPDRIVCHHFPARNPDQYLRKIRNGAEAYSAAPDVPKAWGQHWRELGACTDDEIRAQFWRYWVEDPATDPDLVDDPVHLLGVPS